MSNNPKTENPKEEETKLLGNKKKAENEIELKEEKTNICHICEKEKSSFLECSNCHISFCNNCISNIISKEKFENLIADENEKIKWLCFICQKNCPCKKCSNNDICLLCNEKNNLSNYNEIIKKLPYSQEENNILKTKDKDIKKILENEEKILICSNCIQKSNILSNFLSGKPFSSLIENKEEKNQNLENKEKKPKENIFNVLDKQIGNNINSKSINFPQSEVNNINFQNNPNSNIINNNINENSNKDLQQVFNEENQKNFIPGLNNNIDNQIPFFMNFPRNSNLNNNTNNNNTKELTSTFAKIAESLQNFNSHNLQNNLNVLSNINQLTGIISSMLNDSNKKGEEKKDENSNSSNSMISYMMTIIEDLKKQINVIQYYTQLQKYFINYIMKYLELFMEQISNQNYLNEQKGNYFSNQIPNLFQMPMPNLNNMNPPVMNIIKQMPIIPINTTTIIPGLNIPNIPSLNLNQNNNDDKKESNKNTNFNLMFQQNNQNSNIPLKINGLNPMINNISIPNLHEQNMFAQIKNSQNSNLNKMNSQFIPNQNNNNPNLNNPIPNIPNQLFPQFNLNNQSINPQNLFFNTQNNNNNNNDNNMSTNINNLGNINNLNNNSQGTDFSFNPSILNQPNPFLYQMLMNNQNPIDLNDKNEINNSQIKKEN